MHVGTFPCPYVLLCSIKEPLVVAFSNLFARFWCEQLPQGAVL